MSRDFQCSFNSAMCKTTFKYHGRRSDDKMSKPAKLMHQCFYVLFMANATYQSR